MQLIAFLCSAVFLVLDVVHSQSDDDGSSLYTRRYEHLDIDTILASPRLVTNYVECLLNKKPCPPEGKALKRILPEALRTKCSRCWPSQKEGALKVITALHHNYPKYYKDLREKWDPTGEYHRRFEEYLRDQKFNAIGENNDGEPGEDAQRPIRQDDTASGLQAGYRYSTASGSNSAGSDITPVVGSSQPKPENSEQSKMLNSKTDLPTQQPQKPQSQNPVRPSNPGNATDANVLQSGSGWNHNKPSPTVSPTMTYYLKSQNPVLNIFNRLTMKFANTAEFLAGMIRGAVPTQPQQK